MRLSSLCPALKYQPDLQGAAVAATACAILQQATSARISDQEPASKEGVQMKVQKTCPSRSENYQESLYEDVGPVRQSWLGSAAQEDPLSRNGQTMAQPKSIARNVDGMPLGEEDGNGNGLAQSSSKDDCLEGSHEVAPMLEAREVVGNARLEFAVLCTAFMPRAESAEVMRQKIGTIELPSLHVFAQTDSRKQAQIPIEESLSVQNWFDQDRCCVLRVARGHALPADRQSIGTYRRFLKQFVNSE